MLYAHNMPYLYKKHFGGRTYWYLRETERKDGKVRVKWQKYLGTPQSLLERLEAIENPQEPLRLSTESFGGVFVAHVIEERLHTIELIDKIVPRDPREVGPSVGEYFFYAWANRMIAPKSKRALEAWYRRTAIQQLRAVDLAQLSSERYWEKWERVSAEQVERIGAEFFKKVWARQATAPECVLFDTTNYYTYQASENPSELAQRGHSKAGKHHLRQVGVGVLVDRATKLPLHYREYEGNLHDSKVFQRMMDEMFGVMCGFNATKQRLTVVFDKGINSDTAFEEIDDQTRIHFVTSYSPYFAEEYAGVELDQFAPLAIAGNLLLEAQGKGADRIVAHRTAGAFWGKERVVVVTHNPVTARKKWYTLERKLETLREALLEFRALYRQDKPHWRDPQVVQERYERMCERLHVGSQYYRLEFGDRRKAPEMSFRKDDYQVQKTVALHGRNIIITDNTDWTTEEIVQLSLDRYGIEQQFRVSKSARHVSMNPFFHWTDSKIRCQVLTCIMALTALRLFELDCERAHVSSDNGDHSAATLMEEMHALHTVLIWKKGHPAPQTRIEDPTALQSQTLAALGYCIKNGSVLRIGR